MGAAPPLSIGLPVYNGEAYLEQSLDAVLGQTFGDFELILCSNASTDATDDICRRYEREDERVRFLRQPTNVGAAPNHTYVFQQARAPLFKWVSGDDLYGRDLLEKCMTMLSERPDIVLAHSYTAAIDGEGRLLQAMEYPLATDDPRAPRRLESLLFAGDSAPGAIRADDFYGIIRSDVLRSIRPHDSFFHADQTFTCELALRGPFGIVPEWLYFRRHHPGRAFRANPTIRAWCSNLDPKRKDRLRHPTARLLAEYAVETMALIHRSPISADDRRECYAVTARWMASRVSRRARGAHRDAFASPRAVMADPVVDVLGVVPGQQGRR
jgi:glycosyltransferase involved in cell wall biosynthesis